MPEMTISDAQAEFLESLRTEIQAETRYGYVRKRDALQYLIDNVDADDIDADADVAPPSETDDEAGDESTEEQAAEAVEHQDEAEATADGGAGADGSTQAEAADGGTTSASSSPMPDPSDGGEEGDDRLNAMMNLLDTHEDKWREASKEDARYEVDMPDGTTQYVQTKDDVRAHLFKNY
ncbi:hypothetical protein [Haloarchaeobius iranensis]|uniref:Uncharacterized protein n=1 Tax=Haloarchaeobius iranensis TaxID=996166 RepID=A0A1G9WEE1_9EURY|nr:hypothetical protein [Haloarchaeobius iranensis]SDM82667.1 hypothetical protein SAMN05192554_10816 [Haloarchaeobius iranensis]